MNNQRIYLGRQFRIPDFATEKRQNELFRLGSFAKLEDLPIDLNPADATGVVAIIADSTTFPDEFYAAADELRVVARWGVGFDQVNVSAATSNGVLVTIAPVHTDTVAEYAITQWLAIMKRTYTFNQMAHSGNEQLIRCYDVRGSSLGLYGFGRIGQEVAKRAIPLLGPDGRLIVYDIREDIHELAASFGAEVATRPEDLFTRCDTVSLHMSGTEPIVHYDQLSLMQPHASLINPSRGNLVDDAAALRAINEGKMFYYVVDDPLDGSRAVFRENPRIISTNHSAGITMESAARLDKKTFEQVTDAMHGRKPDYILNPEALHHSKVRSWIRH